MKLTPEDVWAMICNLAINSYLSLLLQDGWLIWLISVVFVAVVWFCGIRRYII